MSDRCHALVNLALIPSFECDVACAHCVFTSSPTKKGRLPLESAKAAISELRRISTVERVTVSGGEPFLDYDYLIAVASHVQDESLKFRVVTNASFATSVACATEILAPLKKRALESIAISWDAFHGRFIDPTRVRNALRACGALDIPVRLTFVATKSQRLGPSLELLGPESFEVPLAEIRCLPIGRAARQVPSNDLLPVPEWDRQRACKKDFDTLALTHDGSVYPCCAVGGFTDGIRLGSIHSESLASMLHRRDNDSRWLILTHQGPRHFLQYASQAELADLAIDEEMHDCVACHRLFSSPLGERLAARARAALLTKASRLISQHYPANGQAAPNPAAATCRP